MGQQSSNQRREVDFNTAVKELSGRKVYMLLGFGNNSLYKNVNSLEAQVEKIAKKIKKDSIFLYFGDVVNPNSPDIGYAFSLLQKHNPTIKIFMIQIDAAKGWGISPLLNVSGVLWHSDYIKGGKIINGRKYCEWGGFDPDTNKPCSNTKIWYDLAKAGVRIKRAYVLGGGLITLDEMKLLISMRIPICFFAFERKYRDDAKTTKTLIPDDASIQDRYGPTHIYVFDE